METLFDRIMRLLGFKEEPEDTQEAVLDFLSSKPDERRDAAEKVDFLKDLRT